jgi:hypothetical protein
MVLCTSEEEPEAGSCEHGYELLGSIQTGDFLPSFVTSFSRTADYMTLLVG